MFKAVYTPSGGGLPLHVAVKTSKAQSSKDELASFMKEMAVMANMMHPNIVRLYGVMTQGMHMCRSAGISVSLLYRCTFTMANTGVLALW